MCRRRRLAAPFNFTRYEERGEEREENCRRRPPLKRRKGTRELSSERTESLCVTLEFRKS